MIIVVIWRYINKLNWIELNKSRLRLLTPPGKPTRSHLIASLLVGARWSTRSTRPGGLLAGLVEGLKISSNIATVLTHSAKHPLWHALQMNPQQKFCVRDTASCTLLHRGQKARENSLRSCLFWRLMQDGGLGAVLSQEHGGKVQPITFASRGLRPAERNMANNMAQYSQLQLQVGVCGAQVGHDWEI